MIHRLSGAKHLLFLVAFLLHFGISKAQEITISGTVYDNNTGESLIGASVVVKGTTIGSVTDINGKFTFKTTRAFPVTITVSYIGYLTQELTVKDSVPLNIRLKTDKVQLQDVNVTGSRISEKQKEAALTIESMDLIAIRETPAANFYEGLGQLKGVDLTSASIGFKIINTRGFNSSSPVRSLQIIDGVDNASPGLNFSLGNFLGASELDILKVDLIVGASSAFYGPNAFNGVISMTTRSPFATPGLEVMMKTGTNRLLEDGVRFAQVIKNKR